MRRHVKELSGKNYQQIYQIKSIDFVLMFVPIEPAYALAAQNDLNLWSEAFEKNIVIVSTSTLLATLRVIHNIWRQENQNKYALEIARQSGELYDKFVSLMSDLEDVRKKLTSTQRAFDDSIRKLKGRDNLIRKVERLKELGANATKQIPQNILDWAGE